MLVYNYFVVISSEDILSDASRIILCYVIKKDCTLGQLITFIQGVIFIFEVAKLLSLRGYLDVTDFFYYMAGAALAYYIYRSIKFFTQK